MWRWRCAAYTSSHATYYQSRCIHNKTYFCCTPRIHTVFVSRARRRVAATTSAWWTLHKMDGRDMELWAIARTLVVCHFVLQKWIFLYSAQVFFSHKTTTHRVRTSCRAVFLLANQNTKRDLKCIIASAHSQHDVVRAAVDDDVVVARIGNGAYIYIFSIECDGGSYVAHPASEPPRRARAIIVRDYLVSNVQWYYFS